MPLDATKPVQKTVTVPLSPSDAFDFFVNGINDWWPGATHSVAANSGDVPARIEIEPKAGGAIRETTKDGKTHDWGTVLTYESGRRLVLSWHPGADPEHAGKVDIVFAVSDLGCRIELTHSGFDAMAQADKTALRTNYEHGWQHVLQDCFLCSCARKPTSVTA